MIQENIMGNWVTLKEGERFDYDLKKVKERNKDCSNQKEYVQRSGDGQELGNREPEGRLCV